MGSYIFGGGFAPLNLQDLTRRRKAIRSSIFADVVRYEKEGRDYAMRRRCFHFDHFFEDTLLEIEERGRLQI
jgi:hypothetical protein